jgi:hypothetical protein
LLYWEKTLTSQKKETMLSFIIAPLVGSVIGYITNDIAIRMLRDPTFRPRKLEPIGDTGTGPCFTAETGDLSPASPPPPEGVSDEEWAEHLDIMKSIGNYQTVYQCVDEPFLDEDEFFDPLLHQRREVFRKRYNFNKHKPL